MKQRANFKDSEFFLKPFGLEMRLFSPAADAEYARIQENAFLRMRLTIYQLASKTTTVLCSLLPSTTQAQAEI